MQLQLARSAPRQGIPSSSGQGACSTRRAGRAMLVTAAATPMRRPQPATAPALPTSTARIPPAANGSVAPGSQRTLQSAAAVVADVALPQAPAMPATPHVPAGAAAPVHVRFNSQWYDLTGWVRAHPAGTHWLERYHGRDATEVFTAFHSDNAAAMLARLPRIKAPSTLAALEASAPADSAVALAFRGLQARLVEEGWFRRDALSEALQLAPWLLCVTSGLAMSHSDSDALRALAFIPLGFSFVDAGWIAHDFIHGRGPWCSAMRHFGGWADAFSATMWSEKHNMHHAATNEYDSDEDLSCGPLMWLWAPNPANDKPWRKFQHLYYLILYSALTAVMRLDSAIVVARNRDIWVSEGLPILGHYALVAALLPWQTYVAATLLSGFVVANIVATSHQSEELIEGQSDDWVAAQFATTRDAVTRNPFTDWAWGGMQYQLEHHLFPTMPRYKYRDLVPVLKQWAAEQGLEYKEADEWEMFAINYQTYKRVAGQPACPGAPDGKMGITL